MNAPGFCCAAVIMAGGQSRRMGFDKAEIVLGGETLLERTSRCCLEAGLSPIIVVGRLRPASFSELDTFFVPDEIPQSGPLGGLISGLDFLAAQFSAPEGDPAKSADFYAAALPCDMPLLTVDALRLLRRIAQDCLRGGASGAATVTPDGKVQPLFAVYSTSLLPAARERLIYGQGSLAGLIESNALRKVSIPTEIVEAIASANTPDELQALVAK